MAHYAAIAVIAGSSFAMGRTMALDAIPTPVVEWGEIDNANLSDLGADKIVTYDVGTQAPGTVLKGAEVGLAVVAPDGSVKLDTGLKPWVSGTATYNLTGITITAEDMVIMYTAGSVLGAVFMGIKLAGDMI
jgi:hypothetical protein